MKRCPTCSRTFEDTFTFCLIDGAILSAPFDPEATQLLPDFSRNNLLQTEIATPESLSGDDLPQTVPSASPIPPPQPVLSKSDKGAGVEGGKGLDKGFIKGMIIILLIFILMLYVGVQQGC